MLVLVSASNAAFAMGALLACADPSICVRKVLALESFSASALVLASASNAAFAMGAFLACADPSICIRKMLALESFSESALVLASASDATCAFGASLVCDNEESSFCTSDPTTSLPSSWTEAELGMPVEELQLMSSAAPTHFDLAVRSSKIAL